MSAEAERPMADGLTVEKLHWGVQVLRGPAATPDCRWNGWHWVTGLQYASDEAPEIWAAGLDAVLGPEEGEA
jgi:hypothetical protein